MKSLLKILGYEGDNCNKNINDCVDHHCKDESVCRDGINEYTCECGEGYQGQLCEEDVNECDDPNFCFNGGNCTNKFGSFTCECKPDWTTDRCNVSTINTLTCEVDNLCNDGNCTNSTGSEVSFSFIFLPTNFTGMNKNLRKPKIRIKPKTPIEVSV